MQPIFIASGTVCLVERGLYNDTEKSEAFFHLVQAETSSDAERKVREHYYAKTEASFGGGPYGTRYRVDDVTAWEQIGEIKLL